MRHGKGHRETLLGRRAAGYRDFDKAAGALAIAHQGQGQFQTQRVQRLLKRRHQRLLGVGGARRAGRAARGKQHRVIGGRVPIDRYAVKRSLDGAPQTCIQSLGGQRRVGGEKGQHGGHIGAQHAGALGYAGERVDDAARFEATRGAFGPCIRGQDALCRVGPSIHGAGT